LREARGLAIEGGGAWAQGVSWCGMLKRCIGVVVLLCLGLAVAFER